MRFLFRTLQRYSLTYRFYLVWAIFFILFIIGFFIPHLVFFLKVSIVFFIFLTIGDLYWLYSQMKSVSAVREVNDKLSNADENIITLKVSNNSYLTLNITVLDEWPAAFQMRENAFKTIIESGENQIFQYVLRPFFRGRADFGDVWLVGTTKVGLGRYYLVQEQKKSVQVYPSFANLKYYELIASTHWNSHYGFKKIRRIGHSLEFEQIKEYAPGDDIRAINWKATAKSGTLKTNLYQDEISQNIYLCIDAGRVMKMPFRELSLLDYAINAAIALASIGLKKKDAFGLTVFSKKIDMHLHALSSIEQQKKIMDALYNIKTDFFETNFERLYHHIRLSIKQRSLLILFTNFESKDGLDRQINYMVNLSRTHQVIIIFFKNEVYSKLLYNKCLTVDDIYLKATAEKMYYEKLIIISELQKKGIEVLYCAPQDLTLQLINTYLKLKKQSM